MYEDDPLYLPEENDDSEGDESLPFEDYSSHYFGPNTQLG
jgi:hypothetical protein